MAVTSWGLTMNIVNSIVGVSVLTMPYCFKECGVVLGTALLLFCAWMTHQTCMMLVKTAFATKRRTYVGLAYQAYGHPGKLLVEASMIGLMLGTCIAFYVVIADLGSSFFGRLLGVTVSFGFRALLLLAVALLIVLPISLQRNLMASLQALSAMALLFYAFFVLVIALTSLRYGLFVGGWMSRVHYWRPAGTFRCLALFGTTFLCHPQVLPTYDSLDEPSVKHMSAIFSRALKIVYTFYIAVGFFGYVSFTDEIAGNVLMNFPSNLVTEAIRMGFVLSVAVSFPMMILPCRQALNTLLFETQQKDGTFTATGFMPPLRFKVVTGLIVFCTMLVSVFVPNVETILGLTGATMGSLICFICPALIYRRLHKDGFIAQLVLWVGLVVLVVSTISTLTPASPEKLAPAPTLGRPGTLHLNVPLVPDARGPNRNLDLDIIAAPDDEVPVVNAVLEAEKAGGGRLKIDSMEEGAAEPPQIEVPKPEPKDNVEDEQGQLLKPDDGGQQALQDEHRHEPPVPRDGVLLDRPGAPVLQQEVFELEDGKEVRHEEVALQDEHRKEKVKENEEHKEMFPDNKPVPGGGGRGGGHDGVKHEVDEHVERAAVEMDAVGWHRADGQDNRELLYAEKEKAPPLPHHNLEGGGIAGGLAKSEVRDQAAFDNNKQEKKRTEGENEVQKKVRDEVGGGAAAPLKYVNAIELNVSKVREAAATVPAAAAVRPGDQRPPAEQSKNAQPADAVARGEEEKLQKKPQGQPAAGADAGAGPGEGEKLDKNLLLEVIKEQQEQQKRLLDQQERLLAVIQEQHKEIHGQEKADGAARPHSQPAPKNADGNEDVKTKPRGVVGGADAGMKLAQDVDNGAGAAELVQPAAKVVVDVRNEEKQVPDAGDPPESLHHDNPAELGKRSHEGNGEVQVMKHLVKVEDVGQEEPVPPMMDHRKRDEHVHVPHPAHDAAADSHADPPARRKEEERKADAGAVRNERKEVGNVVEDVLVPRAEGDDMKNENKEEKVDSPDLRRRRKKRESGDIADREVGTWVEVPGSDALLHGPESPAHIQAAPLSILVRKLTQAKEPDAG